MPQRTIYLSKDLDDEVKASALPVGSICRAALREVLKHRERLADPPPRPPEARKSKQQETNQ
jgi:hypothetical protein